jgi:hypothetical protein
VKILHKKGLNEELPIGEINVLAALIAIGMQAVKLEDI